MVRAVAVARVGLGITALLRPGLVAAPWVGRADGNAAAGQVLGRALGGRDIALGAGALLAARRTGGPAIDLAVWVAAAGGADLVDLIATARSWRRLPRRGRWLVVVAAGGGAVVSAVAARGLVSGRGLAAASAAGR